ncbi:hypothetical protein B0H21DRAFT_346134 [Amylocystis lapponica]|nr:hypothetical protein B0H21DRAFT_346134 [Amylocystis lapponica]
MSRDIDPEIEKAVRKSKRTHGKSAAGEDDVSSHAPRTEGHEDNAAHLTEAVKKHRKRKESPTGPDASLAAGEPAAAPVTDDDQPKKSRKQKRRANPETAAALPEEADRKHKRSERKGETDNETLVSPEGIEPRREDGRKGKKKKKKVEGEQAGDADEVQETKKTRKKKPKDADVVEGCEENAKKKRTHREDEDANIHEPTTSTKKHKKRKHEFAEFVVPGEDESLSEQACKALEYAFSQFQDPASWKFNKARQNWLIRNIWSEEAIPEAHMPLLTRYLANVQGGAREALVKTCHEIAAEASSGKEAKPSLEPQSSPVAGDVACDKHHRAVKLLAVLEPGRSM